MIATKEAVDLVLDADRLSELAGQPVRAQRLRIKPEVSISVGLAEAGTGEVAGWARLLWPANHVKADKVRRRSAQLGLPTRERHLAGGLLVQVGDVATDPALGPYLRRLARPGLSLLRYNPLRRVVARDGQQVVRVVAAADRLGYLIHGLLAPHVALPERLDDGTDPHASIQRHTGIADLARAANPDLVRAAGAQLAALHRVAAGPFAEQLVARVPSAEQQALEHAELIEHLAPELAGRIRALAQRLPRLEGEPVVVHGDFSADQVLHDGARVWLTDFDRVALAPRALDLGSFLAEVDGAAADLLDGYRAGGGRVPDEEQVRRAQLRSAVLRLADPLRAARPNWLDDMVARIDAIEGKLS